MYPRRSFSKPSSNRVQRNLDSFQVWKTFVLNYSNEDFGEYSADYGFKRKTIRDLEMGLDDCIASLMHPSPSWITFLTLTDTACTKTGLIRLSRLSNLGVLTILPCKGTQRVETAVILVDDSLFRAWGRAASEIGAFSKFRIFLCYSQSILTKQAFSYLQDLPSLGLMEFGKCHADVAAGKCSGWIGKQDDEVSEYLGMWHGGSWQVAYESCFDQDGIFDPEKFKSAHRFKFRGPPILDFNLGYEAQDPCRPDLHEPSDKGKLLFHRDRPPGPASSNNDITGRGRPSPSLSDPQGTSTKKPSIRKSKLELSDTVWSEICS